MEETFEESILRGDLTAVRRALEAGPTSTRPTRRAGADRGTLSARRAEERRERSRQRIGRSRTG